MKKYFLHAASISLGLPLCEATTVAITFTHPSFVGTPLSDSGTALPSGTLLQVGYFDTSTASFAGSWISIGDGAIGAEAGYAQFTTSVVNAESSSLISKQLGVRVYNSTTTVNSTRFNTVTDSNWVFPTVGGGASAPVDLFLEPANPVNVSDNLPEWQDNANAFATTLPVPEPSSFALLGLGATALLFRRRK